MLGIIIKIWLYAKGQNVRNTLQPATEGDKSLFAFILFSLQNKKPFCATSQDSLKCHKELYLNASIRPMGISYQFLIILKTYVPFISYDLRLDTE